MGNYAPTDDKPCLSLSFTRNAGLSRRAAGRFRAPGSPGAERREGAPAQPRILPERSEGRTSYYLNGYVQAIIRFSLNQ